MLLCSDLTPSSDQIVSGQVLVNGHHLESEACPTAQRSRSSSLNSKCHASKEGSPSRLRARRIARHPSSCGLFISQPGGRMRRTEDLAIMSNTCSCPLALQPERKITWTQKKTYSQNINTKNILTKSVKNKQTNKQTTGEEGVLRFHSGGLRCSTYWNVGSWTTTVAIYGVIFSAACA